MSTEKYEGMEVVAWQDAENPLYTTAERRVLHDWVNNGYPIVELCRLSDAQRAIAELRGLVPELPPRPPECVCDICGRKRSHGAKKIDHSKCSKIRQANHKKGGA